MTWFSWFCSRYFVQIFDDMVLVILFRFWMTLFTWFWQILDHMVLVILFTIFCSDFGWHGSRDFLQILDGMVHVILLRFWMTWFTWFSSDFGQPPEEPVVSSGDHSAAAGAHGEGDERHPASDGVVRTVLLPGNGRLGKEWRPACRSERAEAGRVTDRDDWASSQPALSWRHEEGELCWKCLLSRCLCGRRLDDGGLFVDPPSFPPNLHPLHLLTVTIVPAMNQLFAEDTRTWVFFGTFFEATVCVLGHLRTVACLWTSVISRTMDS